MSEPKKPSRHVESMYPEKGRVIIHLDMNAFYCSVHAAEEPGKYAGKATAVSGSVEARKGIIVTCSYEARALGIKTGMNVRQALKIYPSLILIAPDFNLYRQYARGFMHIAEQYTPLVERVSIDECYLDITGSKIFGTPLDIATELQQRIHEEWSLPCSIGLAPNKLLAKMASDMKKPNGITVLRLRDVPRILWPKPCRELFGVGSKTAMKLAKMNIMTIEQLAKTDEQLLIKQFGVMGSWLKSAAYGIDHTEVTNQQEPNKSIGHTTTLPADVTKRTQVHRILLNLADQTGRRLRKQQLFASTVQVTIRKPDMSTITRSQTLSTATEDTFTIYHQACQLLDRNWQEGDPIRLLGVTLQNLTSASHAVEQLDLFQYEEQPKKQALTKAMDQIRNKYGESAVLTAGMLGDDPSTLIRNKRIRGTSLQKDDSLLYIDE
ncbi:DNA polymerase IV [Paenibacillus yanchengensis]|uniref:DNA polymerase IV n=1 Tax=Paenibacillus yanchengensis TaxID=2035833 RepID=A0ABW4YNF8_9BACL